MNDYTIQPADNWTEFEILLVKVMFMSPRVLVTDKDRFQRNKTHVLQTLILTRKVK